MSRSSFISILFLTAACGGPSVDEQFDSTTVERNSPRAKYSIVRVADQNTLISAMVLTDNYLYFAASTVSATDVTGTTINRIPKYGGRVERIAGPTDAYVVQLATNNTSVFWVEHPLTASSRPASIMRRDIAGDTNKSIYEGNFPFGMRPYASKDAIYLETLPDDGTHIDTLRRLPLAGGSASAVTALPETTLSWLLADDDLYITDSTAMVGATVSTLPSSGGTLRELAKFPSISRFRNGADLMASDKTNLYMLLDDKVTEKKIVRIARTDGASEDLYTAPRTDPRIALPASVDDQNVYFLADVGNPESGNSTVRAVPKSGGNMKLLAEEALHTFGTQPLNTNGLLRIAEDEKNIFLIYEGREILMQPK